MSVQHRPLNQRQERFCLLIVKGETQSRAYALAGYSCKKQEVIATKASELVRNENVAKRIAELQARIREEHIIDLNFMTDELLDIVAKSKLALQFGAATSAMGLLGKMHGLVVERGEVTVLHRPAPLPTAVLELSEEDWLRQFSRADRKLQALDPPKPKKD